MQGYETQSSGLQSPLSAEEEHEEEEEEDVRTRTCRTSDFPAGHLLDQPGEYLQELQPWTVPQCPVQTIRTNGCEGKNFFNTKKIFVFYLLVCLEK